jgi:hypothetical protein
MSAIIMIEIVVGIVVLAAAVRFAVRDTRQRSAAVEPEIESVETAPVPARGSAPEAEQETKQDAEPVGSPETN